MLKNEDRRFLILIPYQPDLDIWYWVQDTSPCGKIRQKIRDAYKISVNKHFAAVRAGASSLNSPVHLSNNCFGICNNNVYSNPNHGVPSFVPCPVATMPYPMFPQRGNTGVNTAQLQSPNYQAERPNGSRLELNAGSKQLEEQETKTATLQHSLPESSHRGLHLLLEAASSKKTLLQSFHTQEVTSPDSTPPTRSQARSVLERTCGLNGAVAAGTVVPTSACKKQGDVVVEQPAKIPARIAYREETLPHVVDQPLALFHDIFAQGTGLLSMSHNDERSKSPGPALICAAIPVAQQSSFCGGHPKDSTHVTNHTPSLTADDANTQTIDDLLLQDAAILMHHEDDSQTLIDSTSVHSIFNKWGTEK